MTIKSLCLDYPSKKFSQEHSVKEKILKFFWLQIWHDQKKLVPRSPPPKISESRVVGKGKKFQKIFCSKIWHNQKKLVSEPPSEKFSWERSVKEKILKNFWPQIWHDQKSWCTDPSSPKTKTNLETRLLSKGKKIFDPKFGKKSWWTPLPRIQSPECSIKEEIPKTFWKFDRPKKVGAQAFTLPKKWNSSTL